MTGGYGLVEAGVIALEEGRIAHVGTEVPAAFVVRKDDSVSEDDILAACKENLTNYKIPKQVTFVDEVPVTLSGKVLRRQLREDYLTS